MDRLKDKVAIVTGSTSGISVGIARLFAAEGAKVVICGRREEKGQVVVDSIVKEGGEAWYHFMDMTVMESVDKLFADTAENKKFYNSERFRTFQKCFLHPRTSFWDVFV